MAWSSRAPGRARAGGAPPVRGHARTRTSTVSSGLALASSSSAARSSRVRNPASAAVEVRAAWPRSSSSRSGSRSPRASPRVTRGQVPRPRRARPRGAPGQSAAAFGGRVLRAAGASPWAEFGRTRTPRLDLPAIRRLIGSVPERTRRGWSRLAAELPIDAARDEPRAALPKLCSSASGFASRRRFNRRALALLTASSLGRQVAGPREQRPAGGETARGSGIEQIEEPARELPADRHAFREARIGERTPGSASRKLPRQLSRQRSIRLASLSQERFHVAGGHDS